MACTWTVHGLFIDCSWLAHGGVSLACSWTVHGLTMAVCHEDNKKKFLSRGLYYARQSAMDT